jgi:imidazoleglycerol-phosphate dehydratase
MIDMTVNAKGDVEVDAHHTVEDVGLCLGKAISDALGEKKGITRYGAASIPMNEALAEASLDISGRPFVVFQSPKLAGKVGEFDVELAEEFIRALANTAGLTIHMYVRGGTNLHHIVEATFKALARALGEALRPDARLGGAIPSTKAVL